MRIASFILLEQDDGFEVIFDGFTHESILNWLLKCLSYFDSRSEPLSHYVAPSDWSVQLGLEALIVLAYTYMREHYSAGTMSLVNFAYLPWRLYRWGWGPAIGYAHLSLGRPMSEKCSDPLSKLITCPMSPSSCRLGFRATQVPALIFLNLEQNFVSEEPWLFE